MTVDHGNDFLCLFRSNMSSNKHLLIHYKVIDHNNSKIQIISRVNRYKTVQQWLN
jgi:hypothetical protein